jgi:hypothetical protein
MENYKNLETSINKLDYDSIEYQYKKTDVSIKKDFKKNIQQYSKIIIQFEVNEKTINEIGIRITKITFDNYVADMADDFKDAVKNIPDDINYIYISNFFTNVINQKYKKSYTSAFNIYLVNPISSGGKKVVVKYTVKQLQAIASKNNIKITKKVDGKTVRLNKQGLIAKLKRYKII